MDILIYLPNDNMDENLNKIIDHSAFRLTIVKKEKDFFKELAENVYGMILYDVKAITEYEVKIFDIVKGKKNAYAMAMTDYEDRFSITEALKIGIDDFLIRDLPYSSILGKLVAVRRFIVRCANSGEEFILTAHDLTLNIVNRLVMRNNHIIELTNKEFSVLEYLLRNKNKIVKRSELAEKYWDVTAEDSSNIVDVYINFLRKKVNKYSDKDLIKTIRGIGYTIQEGIN